MFRVGLGLGHYGWLPPIPLVEALLRALGFRVWSLGCGASRFLSVSLRALRFFDCIRFGV